MLNGINREEVCRDVINWLKQYNNEIRRILMSITSLWKDKLGSSLWRV